MLVLFAAGFLTIINETIPAGLLPQIADTLHVSESVAGQTVSIYALATALSAVPLSAVLATWGRRTVLVAALAAFVLANAVIAASSSFTVIITARLVAGIGAGLIWSNLAVYAARLVAPAVQGRAMSIANAGTPIALSIGLPAGTLLGNATGWHATFAVVAVAGGVLILAAFAALPNLPGYAAGDGRVRLAGMLRVRGVVTILAVMSGFFLAHNVLYTYVAPLASRAGLEGQTQWVLMTFGFAALLSILITGTLIDRRHRHLTVTSLVLVGGGALLITLVPLSPALLYVAAAAWGLGFGGGATLFLTAGIRTAGDAIAPTMVTLVNLAIAAGGAIGGILLDDVGTMAIPWAALILMVPTALAAILARKHAFPHWTAAD
ncbi:MFS transporter [Actinoplanes sp. NPDC020271]|uniref:MFS transporter n=1 Tax=Actinoplanes sp. NPDC020271 TaxID=3363896 RepID=UPI00379AC01E